MSNEISLGLPSVSNRHNTSSVLSNVLEDRLREVKVVLRRIAPAPSIVRKGIVWWAEIGGCDHNGTRQTPFGVIYTSNLIARTTAQAIVEQSSAQCCSICPIPLTVEVSIPTSTTYRKQKSPNKKNGTQRTSQRSERLFLFSSRNRKNESFLVLMHTHCPRSITASIESGTSVNPSTSTISMRTGDHCKKTHQTKPISKSHFPAQKPVNHSAFSTSERLGFFKIL